MQTSYARAILGRTGLEVCRLGISASYGAPAAAVEKAFERGVNYMYWGSIRRDAFAEALRNLKPQRERMILVLQSYTRVAALLNWSIERALKKIGYDHADVLLLGMWNKPVPRAIRDAAGEARRRGLVRFLAVSTHKRTQAEAHGRDFDIVHFRYNAVHTGAERDIFPYVKAGWPGLVSFTATSWGQLMKSRRIPAGEPRPTAADAYRFVLSRPEVDVCMTGPANADQVDESLRALDLGPMSEAELERLRRIGRAIYGKP